VKLGCPAGVAGGGSPLQRVRVQVLHLRFPGSLSGQLRYLVYCVTLLIKIMVKRMYARRKRRIRPRRMMGVRRKLKRRTRYRKKTGRRVVSRVKRFDYYIKPSGLDATSDISSFAYYTGSVVEVFSRLDVRDYGVVRMTEQQLVDICMTRAPSLNAIVTCRLYKIKIRVMHPYNFKHLPCYATYIPRGVKDTMPSRVFKDRIGGLGLAFANKPSTANERTGGFDRNPFFVVEAPLEILCALDSTIHISAYFTVKANLFEPAGYFMNVPENAPDHRLRFTGSRDGLIDTFKRSQVNS